MRRDAQEDRVLERRISGLVRQRKRVSTSVQQTGTKTVFHIADGAADVQDAAIRYATGIFDDESLEIDAVAVVANASGSNSEHADEIAEMSEDAVQFVACRKSMGAAGPTEADILEVV